MKPLFALLLLAFSHNVFATELWPNQYVSGLQPIKTLADVESLSELYDCGEIERQEFCAFEQSYRGIELDVVISVNSDGDVTEVNYSFPFSVHDFTYVQTALRKDSYHLVEVKIGDKTLTVEELINQGTAQTADKKLVEFLNLYPTFLSKQFTWIRKNEIQNTLATKRLLMTSDAERIHLIWNR
jgi:hypothetical protein